MTTNDFGESTQLCLDRLVCGELDEPTRQKLLAWLDAEPLRWRACGLAFLEAQVWGESLSAGHEEGETCGQALRRGQETRAELKETLAELKETRAELKSSQQPSANRGIAWGAAAACLMLAFALGNYSRDWMSSAPQTVVEKKPSGPAHQPDGPLMASVSLQPEAGGVAGATLQIPVVPVSSAAKSDEEKTLPISDYERQKWERRGYVLTKERRFLPARLPDGKKVAVPVDQVKANYVGSKVS